MVQNTMKAIAMRMAVMMLVPNDQPGEVRPRSVAELVYREEFCGDRLLNDPALDFSQIYVGRFSMLDIALRAMTVEELVEEVERVTPGPRPWDTMGPITLCFDERLYDPEVQRGVVIVGMLKNYPSTDRGRRGVVVGFSDCHVESAQGSTRLAQSLDRSIAYYDSLDIPMPAEMVKELREAMGGE